MPVLDWIGKQAVVRHHAEVPFHLLKYDDALSVGIDSENLLVQGDNLLALKALLPYYAGQVKCIYIDPPYNTGNESWTYNDNVNSPEIREWLGKVVGAEAEDLSRHDKWLCMMYPRLRLLRDFLTEDRAIFVSIDDNEVQHLRELMDEIFGPRNFVATIIWQKMFSPKNSARHLSSSHDYIVLYARNSESWRPNLLPRGAEQDDRYSNPDNDPRGAWSSSDLSGRNYYSLGTYPVTCPSGRVIPGPPRGRFWTVSPENFLELDRANRIWWGAAGNNFPRRKRFLTEVQDGLVPETIWMHTEVGNTQEAKKEIVTHLSADAEVFITPKPVRLIRRILQLATKQDSIVLDAFAGSGTTGHAVLAQNEGDGGRRRFILVEIDRTIAETVAAERLRRVSNGYAVTRQAGQTEYVAGLGGGFRYADLGPPLFEADGKVRESVAFSDLARHVFYLETGKPISSPANAHSPFLGVANGTGVYLLYNGVLGDRRDESGNVLTSAILAGLPEHHGPKVIYADGCRIGPDRLKREGIVFRQLPYDLSAV